MQSCLSKITSVREKDLDLAQKYFAMLYVNEEVSHMIITWCFRFPRPLINAWSIFPSCLGSNFLSLTLVWNTLEYTAPGREISLQHLVSNSVPSAHHSTTSMHCHVKIWCSFGAQMSTGALLFPTLHSTSLKFIKAGSCVSWHVP